MMLRHARVAADGEAGSALAVLPLRLPVGADLGAGPDVHDLVRSLPILKLLLAEAEKALDCDPPRARTALSRAVAVIEADTAGAETGATGRGLAPWQIKKVAAHIEGRLETSIRVEDLADVVRLSCSHFSRAFRLSFGCTPQTYIVDQRIAYAKKLMITTDIPLCDIALACGFSDQAHLTRVFRLRTGHTPGAWRRARGAQ